MSFLSINSLELPQQFKEINDFVENVEAILGDSTSKTKIRSAIEQVLAGNTINQVLQEALVKYLEDNDKDQLIPLFRELSSISEKSNASDRQIGWPAEEWTRATNKAGKGSNYDFSLDLDVEANGGAYLEVMPASDETTASQTTELTFKGSLGGKAKGALNLPTAGVSAEVNTSISRSLVYQVSQPDGKVGLALADSLSRLTLPTNAQELRDQFSSNGLRNSKLNHVVIAGASNLGGKAGVDAKFPSQYGRFGLKLSGELQFDDSFNCKITAGPNKTSLNLAFSGESDSKRGFGVGVSYVVGLSTILPQEAQKLLQYATETHNILVQLDDYAQSLPDGLADAIVTWLKPGNLVSSKLQPKVVTALNKIKTIYGDDLTVIGGLARILGVDIARNAGSDKLIDSAASQLTSVIGKILDEKLDVFDVNAATLTEYLKGVFKDAVDADVLEILDREVFKEASTTLDKYLKELSTWVETNAGDLVGRIDAEIADRRADTTYKKVRSFIKKARTLSKSVLDGITLAQTELIAAEIGYAYAQDRDSDITFEANYDVSVSTANTAFRKAILRPETFISSITSSTSAPDGVKIVSSILRKKLAIEKGPRWSLAFIGFPYGYTSTKLKDIDIVNTLDGVQVTTKIKNEKQRLRFNETRRVSFLSTMNILQARKKNPLESGGNDAGAPPTMGISFVENDSGPSIREVRSLLNGLIKYQLTDKQLANRIIKEAETQFRGDNKLKSFKVDLSVSVPPSELHELLKEYARQSKRGDTELRDTIVQTTAETLVQVEINIVAKAYVEAQNEGGFEALGLRLPADPDGKDISTEDAVTFLLALGAAQRNEARVANTLGLKNAGNTGLSLSSKNIKLLGEAVNAIDDVFELASKLYTSNYLPSEDEPYDIVKQQKEFQSFIESKQDEINDIAGKFLRAGNPRGDVLTWLLGSSVPRRTAILFLALQNVVLRERGVLPPMMINISTDRNFSRTYIAPRPGA